LKKIILSLFTIGVIAVVALVATQAFFNDTETSTGNVLQAGALDLKIDNTCYYNGQACELPEGQTEGQTFWNGAANVGNECSCTWQSKDLGERDVFFSFFDLKPGDWEEDTISVNVDNPSWLCADFNLTRDADNSCTEPENAVVGGEDGLCDENEGDGELDDYLNIVFWYDDGDNVYECTDEAQQECEEIIIQDAADLVLGSGRWALADSLTGKPIPANETFYIGKFFCFGTPTQTPVAQDNQGATGTNGPDSLRGSGFTCDGSLVDNKPQTDSLEGNIEFYAEQARHNDGFLCNPPVTSFFSSFKKVG